MLLGSMACGDAVGKKWCTLCMLGVYIYISIYFAFSFKVVNNCFRCYIVSQLV